MLVVSDSTWEAVVGATMMGKIPVVDIPPGGAPPAGDDVPY
jgi:hypothetical protein